MEEKGKLKYYLPMVDKPHTILHVPGSHTLYVGPNSCTRRHAIRARQFADKRDVSFLFINEADVISGSYEDLIVENIGKLLKYLSPKPYIFMIAVFCIDDFLGTDENALVERLYEKYPDRQFAIQHIDPVSLEEKTDMSSKKVSAIYSFIKPQTEHDNGINFLGHFASLHPDCEFPKLLASWGYGPVRELFNCKTYEEYQNMGKSCLNVVLRFMGVSNVEALGEKLNIPTYKFFASYDAKTVARGYTDIAGLLGVTPPDFSEEIADAESDVRETVKLLSGIPVAIDSTASIMAFSMTRALLNYGFNVRYLFRSSHKFKIEPEAEDYVYNECPDVAVMAAADYKHLTNIDEEQEVIAIGSDAAQVLRAAHYVNIFHDEGYFGFHGIHRLMKEIREAYKGHTDWSKVPALKIKKKKK